MFKLILVVSCLLASFAAYAEKIVLKCDWQEQGGQLTGDDSVTFQLDTARNNAHKKLVIGEGLIEFTNSTPGALSTTLSVDRYTGQAYHTAEGHGMNGWARGSCNKVEGRKF